jgi:hypothetical protein
MNELTAKFQKLEELCSWPEGPGSQICSLLLGPPPDQACWADRLRRQLGDSRRLWLSSVRRMLGWRPCEHLLRLFGLWYWVVLVDHPH